MRAMSGRVAASQRQVILAVETSCDETACAVMADGRIAGELVHSQRRTHSAFGGVVPELASRDHLRRLPPMIAALEKKCGPPTCYAYTRGPGLASALLAGAAVVNALAFARGVPVIAVNHLAGHVLSPLLSRPDFAFPYVALLVSGGHTQLWEAQAADRLVLLGQTLDDAAGEAFDKTAILLGLNYPGGARLERLAVWGNPDRFELPSPAQPDLNFSFSGLKTAVRRLAEKHPRARSDIAAAFQRAAAQGLAAQAACALRQMGLSRLAVVGGVAQNGQVWAHLQRACPAADLHRPQPAHCGDNAAMIALAARLRPIPSPDDYAFTVDPRWQPNESLCSKEIGKAHS